MLSFLKRWRPANLFAWWAIYWIALAALTLRAPVAAIWTATHAPAGQGNVTVNFGDWVFTLLVTVSGTGLWKGSIHLLKLALVIAGPPLVLWALWATQRSAPAPASERETIP